MSEFHGTERSDSAGVSYVLKAFKAITFDHSERNPNHSMLLTSFKRGGEVEEEKIRWHTVLQ